MRPSPLTALLLAAAAAALSAEALAEADSSGSAACSESGECAAVLGEANAGSAMMQVKFERGRDEKQHVGDAAPAPKPHRKVMGTEKGGSPPPGDAPMEDDIDDDEMALTPHELLEQTGDLVSVDCGGDVSFLVPRAKAEDAEAMVCPNMTAALLVQEGRRLGGGANAAGGQAASSCPIKYHNRFCGPRYDVPNLVTLEFCKIFTQEPIFWGNSCSRFLYWRRTVSQDGKEYGPCRCCRYNNAGTFYYYHSSVGNNVYEYR